MSSDGQQSCCTFCVQGAPKCPKDAPSTSTQDFQLTCDSWLQQAGTDDK